jgi:hypothetical protein
MSSRNIAKPPKQTQPGRFSLLFSFGKPPRPYDAQMLRAVFLTARPPLLAVMQGGDYRVILIHSHVSLSATMPDAKCHAAFGLMF